MGYRISKFDLDKLGCHAEIFPGFAFKSDRFTDDPGDIALVKGETVQQGFVDWGASKYWPAADAESFKKFELHAGDVVLAMDRPWVTAGLKWAYIKGHDPKSLLVQRVSRLRAKKEFSQTYLRCLISSRYFSDYIQPIVTGVSVPHISGKQIGNFIIPLPPLLIQQKIAAIVSAYDELIENNNRRIALLEKLAEEIYREWFVRLRYPGYQNVKLIKGAPQTWENKRFGEFCMLKRGYDLPDQNVEPGEYPVMASTSIKTYHNDFKVKPPVVTTGRSGSLGTVLMVNCNAWPLNTSLYVRDFFGNSPNLVFFTLKNMRLESFNSGAGVPTLNRNHINGIRMAVPDKALQKKFDSIVAPLSAQKEKLAKANAILAGTRRAILPRILSGILSIDKLDIHFPPGMMDELRAPPTAAAHA